MNRTELLKNAKPILFNTEMVRAILEGRKTQTRRIVKNSHTFGKFEGLTNDMYLTAVDKDGENYPKPVAGLWATFEDESGVESYSSRKAPYETGDILYVRETFTTDFSGRYYYRADFESDYLDACETLSGGYPAECRYHPSCEGCNRTETRIMWKPSIHMPKEAARIFLKVTDVRVERLRNIRVDGVHKEGVDISTEPFERFKTLWDSTVKDHGTYGWDANPYVWVIEFERVEVQQ